MFYTQGEFIVANKDELIDQIKKSRPGDIIHVRGTNFSLHLGFRMHDPVFLVSGKKSKRYNTNLDRLIYMIEKTPNKAWKI